MSTNRVNNIPGGGGGGRRGGRGRRRGIVNASECMHDVHVRYEHAMGIFTAPGSPVANWSGRRNGIFTHVSMMATPDETSSLRMIAHVFCTSLFCFSVIPVLSSNLLSSLAKISNKPRNSAMFTAPRDATITDLMRNNCYEDYTLR